MDRTGSGPPRVATSSSSSPRWQVTALSGSREAFIESWFGKLKEREVWLNEYETLDDARAGVGGYVDRYHHRPHSGLDYRTPLEVRQTWEDLQRLAA